MAAGGGTRLVLGGAPGCGEWHQFVLGGTLGCGTGGGAKPVLGVHKGAVANFVPVAAKAADMATEEAAAVGGGR